MSRIHSFIKFNESKDNQVDFAVIQKEHGPILKKAESIVRSLKDSDMYEGLTFENKLRSIQNVLKIFKDDNANYLLNEWKIDPKKPIGQQIERLYDNNRDLYFKVDMIMSNYKNLKAISKITLHEKFDLLSDIIEFELCEEAPMKLELISIHPILRSDKMFTSVLTLSKMDFNFRKEYNVSIRYDDVTPYPLIRDYIESFRPRFDEIGIHLKDIVFSGTDNFRWINLDISESDIMMESRINVFDSFVNEMLSDEKIKTIDDISYFERKEIKPVFESIRKDLKRVYKHFLDISKDNLDTMSSPVNELQDRISFFINQIWNTKKEDFLKYFESDQTIDELLGIFEDGVVRYWQSKGGFGKHVVKEKLNVTKNSLDVTLHEKLDVLKSIINDEICEESDMLMELDDVRMNYLNTKKIFYPATTPLYEFHIKFDPDMSSVKEVDLRMPFYGFDNKVRSSAKKQVEDQIKEYEALINDVGCYIYNIRVDKKYNNDASENYWNAEIIILEDDED